MEKRRILVVDDQPSIRLMVRLTLQEAYELDEAENGDEAWEKIQDHAPDALVLDVMMPGSINGFQLCERVKKDVRLKHIVVVLVTACGQVSDQEMGRALGADAYFVKPFSPLDLERQLTRLLADDAPA
ncbi:MAG: response regulator [Gammaproteobacteria bacterium SHHR-1]